MTVEGAAQHEPTGRREVFQTALDLSGDRVGRRAGAEQNGRVGVDDANEVRALCDAPVEQLAGPVELAAARVQLGQRNPGRCVPAPTAAP